ncbi:MAG: MFS transporter [Acidimicrobiia bacterium]|nr:MFS transporter [Acidimicrobiia bacterium]
MGRWKPLVGLGIAQFLMVLDTAVMNVSISQLVHDFHTQVTAIQAVITLYALVMAALMITGGKLGDIWGRRRAFTIGICVYAVGSATTAAAPTVLVLALGWSVIEGCGAALVLPALAALVGANFKGKDRAAAYGVIGGLSGAGIAVGPLLGGWVTTYLTWRLVFAGEVVVVLVILAVIRWINDAPLAERRARLDGVGSALSAAGLAMVVLAMLQSSTWGWVKPRNSPVSVFGFSLTPFLLAAGLVVLYLFRRWEARRERRNEDPLIRWRLFSVPVVRAGLSTLTAQNLILLGTFFVIPLYLQVVQGFTAFQTGLRLLPVSVTMLVAALLGPRVAGRSSPRRTVRFGLVVVFAAILWLLGTIKPQIDDLSFAGAMALLGIGMGLLASQLGNVLQSSVDDRDRSEVGGLQYTAQNLGSSIGTALIGSILIGALAAALTINIKNNPEISAAVQKQVGVRLEAGISFVPTSQVEQGLKAADVPPDQANALITSYKKAQLDGLKAALLAAAAIALAGLLFTDDLPAQGDAPPPEGDARSSATAPRRCKEAPEGPLESFEVGEAGDRRPADAERRD